MEGQYLAKVEFIIMVALVLISSANAAESILNWKSSDYTFTYDESMKGTGSFAKYENYQINGPHPDHRITQEDSDMTIKRFEHGSGALQKEKLLAARNLTTELDFGGNLTKKYGVIWLKESGSLLYSPQIMSIGTGYYSSHPIRYDSMLGETTVLKNYAIEAAIQRQTLYAHSIDMNMTSEVKDRYLNNNDAEVYDDAWASLAYLETVKDGTTHLNILQGNAAEIDASAWKNPSIDLDEVYSGSFDIAGNATLKWPVVRKKSNEDILPCCFGGIADINPLGNEWLKHEFAECDKCPSFSDGLKV